MTRTRTNGARWIPFLLGLGLLGWSWMGVPCLVRAQSAESLAGRWRAGATQVAVDVSSWGPDCGPRPRSTTRGTARVVEARDRSGHLAFGAPLGRRTDQCWSENRALRRTSTTRQGNRWTTRCETPADDSRGERGTYVLEASSRDVLVRRSTSRYDWQLNESRCVATVTETQRFERIPSRQPGTDPSSGQGCTPGEPVRLRVRPESRRIAPGDRACFRATLLDAADCPAPADASWSLERPPGLGGQLRGRCFQAAASAAAAEGTFGVVARAGGLEGRATVVVQTADLSDLRAQRIAGADGDGDGIASAARAEEAARLAASSGGDGPSMLLLIGLAAAGLLLVGLGTVVIVGRRRRPGPTRVPPAESAAAASSAPPFSVPAAFAPALPGTPTDPAPPPAMTTPPSGASLICPVCRRGYSGGTDRCPRDDVPLLPYDVFVARHKEGAVTAEEADTRRVCPTCGTEYGGETRFCGRDGSALHLVK